MSTEREHAHDRKHDDDHRDHEDRSVGRVNRSAMLTAPTNPVTSGLVARKAARDDNGVESGADHAIATAASSSGVSLPSPIMRKFEASLGADLSGVRVHTGAESQSAASAVGAKAYTMGQDIHFGAGHYDPSSGPGEHLLAHEVAHTVQQGGGAPTRQNKLEVSTPFDPAEHEADSAADAMVAGRAASVSFGSGVARKVMREKEGVEATVSSKGAEIVIPEIKLDERPYRYLTFSAAVKASGSLELVEPGEGEGGGISGSTTGGTNGPGIQAAAEVVQEKVKHSLLGIDYENKTSEKLSYEVNAKKVAVGVAVGGEAVSSDSEFPIHGTYALTLTGLEADWEELEKDPSKIKVLTAEMGFALKGGGLLRLPGTEKLAKSEATVEITGEAKPNWGNIGVDIAKNVAKQGATTAGTDGAAATAGSATAEGAAVAGADTAVAIDASSVGVAAAAVIAPLGAAALMVGGAVQTGKNIDASAAAAAYGTKLRVEAIAYAKAYAATIAGSQKTTNRGSLDANIVVMEYMASSGKARQEACADLLTKNGPGLEDQILKQTRDRLYDLGCTAFDTQYASEFGFLEHLGPTWGMRNVFRDEFRMLLYSNG